MRYTITFLVKYNFDPKEIDSYSPNWDIMTNYYAKRIPKKEVIDVKTMSEVNEWKKLIDNNTLSFVVKDNASGKIIFKL